jgi:two-component system, chemotaxis family, sensor kinase CheA
MDDNREFIGEFLVESSENLDQLDRDLLALEEQPDDAQRVASIFRTVHTIKGNSGFFGFSKLGALAHSGEHLLGRVRDGTLTIDDRVTGSLYSMVDAVRSILASIEKTGTEGDHDFRELARTLAAVAADEGGPRGALSSGSAAVPAGSPHAVPPLPVADVAPVAPRAVPPAAEPCGAAPDAARPHEPSSAASSPAPQSSPAPAVADTTIRVDVGLLASILDLVGELVLARNQLRSIDSEDPAVQAVAQRINAVTTALQETSVKTRMQPIDHVFSKFPRTVRDLAVSCGKEVQFVVDGADTELDRSLIESIRDPLTHLIRNAVDHGIEPPDVRSSKGKPRAGRLALRAFHESGQVTIEVADDGGGIAVDAVREKAVSRGLVAADVAASLPHERILQFIFEPGFSTASTVTSVSGRGVGMDVVKTNIESIGGTVDIQSRPGLGTTVRVRVPLTLAIIPALIVRCGDERFAIPQSAVNELVSVRHDRGGPRIEGLADAPVMRVRGRLVPVVFLDEFLGLRQVTACRDQGTVVLVTVDGREFGIVVDGMHAQAAGRTCRELLDTASLSTIVVKPIGGLLAQLGIYSGATVMGDGGVVLILGLRGLLQAVGIPPLETGTEAGVAADVVPVAAERFLVCRTGSGRRVALPLASIVRLEQFASDEVQPLGRRTVVRRGDAFTPVLDADELLGANVRGPAATRTVVVLDERCGAIGVSVAALVDVLEAESPLQPELAAAGVAGSLALGGVATEVLDVAAAQRLAAGSLAS